MPHTDGGKDPKLLKLPDQPRHAIKYVNGTCVACDVTSHIEYFQFFVNLVYE